MCCSVEHENRTTSSDNELRGRKLKTENTNVNKEYETRGTRSVSVYTTQPSTRNTDHWRTSGKENR
jgi:hypothetical protein